jgi:hypothetical protein
MQSIRNVALLILFVALTRPAYSTDNTVKIESQLNPLPVEKLQIAPQLKSLKKLTVGDVRLNQVVAPRLDTQNASVSNDESSQQSQEQPSPRPFPQWESPKIDNSLRLFPIMTDGKRAYGR